MVLAHGYRAARQGSLPGPASRSWRERREAFRVDDDSGSAGKRVDRRPEYPADDGCDECKHADSRDDHQKAVHGRRPAVTTTV